MQRFFSLLMFDWMHLDIVAIAISLAYWWHYGTIVCTIVLLARGSWSCSTDRGAFFKSVGRCDDLAWCKKTCRGQEQSVTGIF